MPLEKFKDGLIKSLCVRLRCAMSAAFQFNEHSALNEPSELPPVVRRRNEIIFGANDHGRRLDLSEVRCPIKVDDGVDAACSNLRRRGVWYRCFFTLLK